MGAQDRNFFLFLMLDDNGFSILGVEITKMLKFPGGGDEGEFD